LLREKGVPVVLWARRAERVEAMRAEGENSRYLPGVHVPPDLAITHRLEEALRRRRVVVLAVPSQHFRAVAREAAPFVPDEALLVSATKGIDESELLRMTQVLRQEMPGCGEARVATLAGPSHAEEVARRLPTAVVAAAGSADTAEQVRETFMTAAFRVYTNDDLTGVELAVALKNIVAIAAGLADGLGFGDNTRGALVTRGLAEITRLGVALGARERTFWGLAGLGELVTTCVSPHSRNRRLGVEVARGASLGQALERMAMVAEGVPTTRGALRLAEKHGVEMPITREVSAILFDGKDPLSAMHELMQRQPRAETL
jgi:glycerol-3-phosphate dehydrogenase (NAD(P)+)